MTSAPRSRWYSSFYWRIGISFVVLVVVVLAAQGIMVSYLMARSERGAFRPPNVIAAEIAADVGAVLAHEPGADVTPVLQRRRDVFPRVYVVLRDGRAFASTAQPIPDDIRSDAQAVLSGTVPGRTDGQPRITGPVVSAPIQVSNELTGLVVMPPPPRGGILSDVGRLLSLPGTLILIIATAVAAIVIFAPARRRLRSLEAAAESFGSGNLAARAPESGSDEIARVAHAFNRMAADLAARDEALRTSDRLRRQMFADVSHELKTPLTAMLGYLDTLQMPEMQIDAETRRRYLATVRQETHRLERIVRDLLDLARHEGGVSTLEVRVFAIERVFDAVIRRHEREAQERQVTLAADVDPSADQIVGDPDRIEQVIENLVANALRHTPPGGKVEMQATSVGNGWGLAVIDSGEGIAAEHLPHVFDRFHKVDSSRMAGASGGSGLGLSIARAIVTSHGGTIRVTSRPSRTEFAIVLPRGDGGGDGAIPDSDSNSPSHSTSANL